MLWRNTRIALFCLAIPAFPQNQKEIRSEIDQLRQEVRALTSELNKVKSQLREEAMARGVIEIGDSPTKGNADAKVIMIEYSDYQCPFCLEYFKTTYPKIMQDYVATGKIRYIVRDYPSEQNHPAAMKSAQAANCAAEQGRFWEMHDALFTNQRTLNETGIADSARSVGLNMPKFQSCIDSGKYSPHIRQDIDDASRVAVRGTPTFYFAAPEPGNTGRIRLVKSLVGANPYVDFQKALDALLPKATPSAQ